MLGAVLGGAGSVVLAPDPLASSELADEDLRSVNPLAGLPSEPAVLVIGDSYTEGIGASRPDRGWVRIVAETLSWNITIDAVGGTGFAQGTLANGRTDLAFRQRMDAHRASDRDFDLVVLQGGLNDYFVPHRAEVATVVGAVEAAREHWPDAAIVIFGPVEPLGGGVRHSARADAVREGAEESDAVYIDPASPSPWFTQRNSARFDSGDGLHVNDAGHAYLAARFAAALQAHLP